MRKRLIVSSRWVAGALWLASLAMPNAPRAEGADYLLGAGDLVRVNVFGHPDMTADVRVDESGSIRYALVGSLQVTGRSTPEVEAALARAGSRTAASSATRRCRCSSSSI